MTPGMGAWSGWVEPAWPSGQLGGGLPCPPGPSSPPHPSLAGRPFSHMEFLCVGGRKEGGRGRGGPGWARWCVLGLICWERGGGPGHGGPLSQSLLCLPGSWASGIGFAAFLPHQNLPSITTGAPHTGTPSPPTLARSKPRPGMPRWGQAGVTRTAVPRGGAGEGTMGPGLWHLGCG